MKRADIVAAARKYAGARWSHQGRQPSNLDCLGLIVQVAKDVGYEVDDRTDYGLRATDESMLEECARQLVKIDRKDVQPGDVVVLAFTSNRHIAIVGDYKYGGLTLIHAQTMHPRIVIENQFSDEWMRLVKARVMGCFSFPGVDE